MDNPGSPILKFLKFCGQALANVAPDGATVIEVESYKCIIYISSSVKRYGGTDAPEDCKTSRYFLGNIINV